MKDRIRASIEEYRENIQKLKDHGYKVYPIHYNGKNPMTWTFSHNGVESAYGWDSESRVISSLLANLGEQPK